MPVPGDAVAAEIDASQSNPCLSETSPRPRDNSETICQLKLIELSCTHPIQYHISCPLAVVKKKKKKSQGKVGENSGEAPDLLAKEIFHLP